MVKNDILCLVYHIFYRAVEVKSSTNKQQLHLLVLLFNASIRIRLFYCRLKILLQARHVIPTHEHHNKHTL